VFRMLHSDSGARSSISGTVGMGRLQPVGARHRACIAFIWRDIGVAGKLHEGNNKETGAFLWF